MGREAKNKSYAVILAGGSGERFWPESRAKKPKYTMKIMGSKSLIVQTVARLNGLIPKKNILVVTTRDQAKVIRGELKGTIGDKNILIEPVCRDTAAAIGLASICVKKKNPEATMVVLPADHYIRDTKGFKMAIKNAVNIAQKGRLVTLGINPTFPSTGYGYIEVKGHGSRSKGKAGYFEVKRFVEKPNRLFAERFLKSKKFFWNAGIFAWKADVVLDSMKRYMPDLYKSLVKIEKGTNASSVYKGLKKVSIDYGIMEKAKNKALISAKFDWTDLGSWFSLAELHKKDKENNAIRGLNIGYKTKNSAVFTSKNHLVATVGIKNLVIVHTDDATLVADISRAQEVKKIVEFMRKKGLKKYL